MIRMARDGHGGHGHDGQGRWSGYGNGGGEEEEWWGAGGRENGGDDGGGGVRVSGPWLRAVFSSCIRASALLCNKTPLLGVFRYRPLLIASQTNAILFIKTPFFRGFCYGE